LASARLSAYVPESIRENCSSIAATMRLCSFVGGKLSGMADIPLAEISAKVVPLARDLTSSVARRMYQ
jgi:hypothetical protein